MPKKAKPAAKKAAPAAKKSGGAKKSSGARVANVQISKGLYKFSKSAVGRRRSASYKQLASKGTKFPKAKKAPAAEPAKFGKYYATEDLAVPRASNKSKRNPTKLRASITPVRQAFPTCLDLRVGRQAKGRWAENQARSMDRVDGLLGTGRLWGLAGLDRRVSLRSCE